MFVITVVYFSHICYESHLSFYFDCVYIGVSEGGMKDDSIATIGSQFPVKIIILFIPLSWPYQPLKNRLNRVILRFRLASFSWFTEMKCVEL